MVSLGRHPCLWCCITSKDMALPKASRPPSDVRTLQKLSNDYKEFTEAGSLLKNAKNFNNVIGKIFFDIPPNFVSLIFKAINKEICLTCNM